jgi:hypothetical protein
MTNAIKALVDKWQAAGSRPPASEFALLLDATGSLVDSAGDETLIDEYRQALKNVRSVLQPHADASRRVRYRLACIRVLEKLTNAVGSIRERATWDRETSDLIEVVEGKTHALTVLRQIALGYRRPSEIAARAELADAQVHRVLSWCMALELVDRWEPPNIGVHYRLTARGEAGLEAIDEPVWLPIVATLLGVVSEARVGGADRTVPQELVEKASKLSGLTLEKTRRAADALLVAGSSVPASKLALAMGMLRAQRQKLIFCPRLYPETFARATVVDGTRAYSRSEALLMRTLERSGIPYDAVDDDVTLDIAWDNDHLAVDRPCLVLSLGSPAARRLIDSLSSSTLIDDESALISWAGDGENAERECYYDLSRDRGMVIRLHDQTRRISHFLIGGGTPNGLYYAARHFYETVESLLRKYPNTSFASIVEADQDSVLQTVAEGAIEPPHAPVDDKLVAPPVRPDIPRPVSRPCDPATESDSQGKDDRRVTVRRSEPPRRSSDRLEAEELETVVARSRLRDYTAGTGERMAAKSRSEY